MSDKPSPTSASERFLSGFSPPKPRSRIATVLTTLLSVALLAVCGVCAGGLYFFRPQLEQDASRVGVVEAQMVRIDVPPAFEPRGTIEWDLLWLVLMRGTYYELTGGDGMLMLLQVDSRLMEEADVREHVERTLREKGGGGPPLTITSSGKFMDVLIRDSLVTFRERIGTSPVDQTRYHLVEGIVDGHAGKVLVAFRLTDDAWEMRKVLVEQTIKSIR